MHRKSFFRMLSTVLLQLPIQLCSIELTSAMSAESLYMQWCICIWIRRHGCEVTLLFCCIGPAVLCWKRFILGFILRFILSILMVPLDGSGHSSPPFCSAMQIGADACSEVRLDLDDGQKPVAHYRWEKMSKIVAGNGWKKGVVKNYEKQFGFLYEHLPMFIVHLHVD